MSEKKISILKKLSLVCIIIMILEMLIMFVMKWTNERKLERIDTINGIEETKDGYITVGMSDFHNSKSVHEKIYDYENPTTKQNEKIIASQARIAKLDGNMNTIWEKSIDNDFDSVFYDIIAVDDYYIAVGSYSKDYDQILNNTRTGMVVKYDKDGNIIWFRDYSVLSDTEFYRIIIDDNDFIVIGKSIYENMEIGNHTSGGGIIIRLNSDGEILAHNNYGGNKSGSFNDIIKVNDGYIVCGKDAANYGIVLKLSKDFNREETDTGLISKKVLWQRTYSNTDNRGFTSMAIKNDVLYIAGAINISEEKDDKGKTIFKYDAGIVSYNTNGKYLGKFSLGSDTHYVFNSIITMDDKIYVSCIIDSDEKNIDKNHYIYSFNINDKGLTKDDIVEKKNYSYENNSIINRLVILKNKLYYIGTNNDNCGLMGCNYESFIKEY